MLEIPDGDVYAPTSDDTPFAQGEYVEIEGHVAERSFCQQSQAAIEVEALQEVDRGWTRNAAQATSGHQGRRAALALRIG